MQDQLNSAEGLLFFQRGPLGDRGGAAGTSQHGHQSDDDHTDEGVLQIDGGTGVFQRLEVPNDLVQGEMLNIRHRSVSVQCREGCHRGMVYQEIIRGASVTDRQGYAKCAPALPDQMFYCTQLDWNARQILSTYAFRWAIECMFENCKQLMGLGEQANRVSKAVERTAPMAFFLYSIVVVWFHQVGHEFVRFPGPALTKALFR